MTAITLRSVGLCAGGEKSARRTGGANVELSLATLSQEYRQGVPAKAHLGATFVHPTFVENRKIAHMNTEYLDQLADQLKGDKSPACRRAINRILADMKQRCKDGEYDSPLDAEAAFRKFVEVQTACQKAKSAERR
jgi:hypothetical protein